MCDLTDSRCKLDVVKLLHGKPKNPRVVLRHFQWLSSDMKYESKWAVILGANSGTGLAICLKFAEHGYNLVITGRRSEDLSRLKAAIESTHSTVVLSYEFDVLDYSKHEQFSNDERFRPSIVVCCIGLLEAPTTVSSLTVADRLIFESNFAGPSSILTAFARRFEAIGEGTIIGIGSVSGLRGGASPHYTYSAAKAGFIAFLSGLRSRLHSKNVHVCTVLPGFVNTKMFMRRDAPKFLVAEPVEVATAVYNAYVHKKNVIYVRPIWRFVMIIINVLPEFLFKRLTF